MLEVNIHAPLQIINWAIQTEVKQFFHASSEGVYRNPGCPVKEFLTSMQMEKKGFRLDSKLSAELLLKDYSHYFATFAIIRPFFIYGQKQDKTILIPRLTRNIITAKEITLNGEEGIKLSPIYVDDAAIAFEKRILF
jgi:UDP-glucose 4-epimerase